jgi:hypothetical protein
MQPVVMLVIAGVAMFSVIGGVSLLSHYYTLNGIKSRTVGDGQHGTGRKTICTGGYRGCALPDDRGSRSRKDRTLSVSQHRIRLCLWNEFPDHGYKGRLIPQLCRHCKKILWLPYGSHRSS